MKKNFILKHFFILCSGLFLLQGIAAQTTYTVNIPANYANINLALNGERGKMVAGDSLIITIDEGTYIQTASFSFNWQKSANILIKGAGAGKTILQGNKLERPAFGSDDGIRQGQVTNTVMSGSSITYKDLTFRYYGQTGSVSVGVILNLGGTGTILTGRFINVIFDSNMGLALLNTAQPGHTFEVDNCLFINNATAYRTDSPIEKAGLVNVRRGGNLIIRNSTFISNDNIQHNGLFGVRGGLFWMGADSASVGNNIVIENNAFINMVNKAPYDSLRMDSICSIITLNPSEYVLEYKVTMKNNIGIGNTREGKSLDCDVIVINPAKFTFVEMENNIFNKVFNRIATEINDTTTLYSYENYTLPGSKINTAYTYTHPDIDFVMDGNLPLLEVTAESSGIGKVKFNGDGGTAVNIRDANPYKIYAFERTLKVTGLRTGERIEVFTITGSLFTSALAVSDEFSMEMPRGIYVIRTGNRTQKVLIH
jgi:hypothetical protein